MSLIDEMRNLREDIESGKKIRSRRIKEIKEDLDTFMKDSTQKRKEDFKAHTKDVSRFITELEKDVEVTRKENRAKQRELRKEFSAAQVAFWGKSKVEEKKKEKEE